MTMFSQNVVSLPSVIGDIMEWLLQHPRSAIVSTTGALLTYHVIKEIRSRPVNLPPGPRPLPFIGSRHLLDFSKLFEDFTELRKKHGDVFTIYIFSTPFIILNSHAAIKEAFFTDRIQMAGRPPAESVLEIMNEEVFMVDYSEEWKTAKKYGVTGVKQYGGKQSAMPDIIMKEVEFLVDSFMAKKTKPIDPTKSLQKAAGNLASALLYGIYYEDHDHPELMELTEGVVKWYEHVNKPLPWDFFYPQWLTNLMFAKERDGFRKACANLRTFHLTMLDKVDTTRDANNPRSVVEYFLSTRSIDELGGKERFADTIGIYSVDPIDGVVNIVRWALLYLAYFPDQQKELQQLTDNVVRIGQRVSINEQTELGLVESFIYEMLRHRSIISTSAPHTVTRDDATFRGYHIPRDVLVFPNYAAANMDPAVYSDPTTFQIDRFVDSGGRFQKPTKLILFGLGPRACPGEPFARLEIFLLISNLLHFFHISFPSDQPKPSLNYNPTGLNRAPYDDFEIVFNKRE